MTSFIGKVLLIEDDPIAQYVEAKILKKLNYDVDLVSNATAALELLKTKPQYDFILSDLGLPDKNGFELIKQIRELEKGKDTPIIVLTGYIFQEEQKTALAVGANEVLTKPITLPALQKVLSKFFIQDPS